ncbi:MAG: hypothetical protein RL341_1723 [Pseudomonadota bacterium]|jgi:hypothetical protein
MRVSFSFLTNLTASSALPYTLLGIGLARLAGARMRTVSGITLAHGGRLPRWLAAHPLGAMSAITLGNVVLARDDAALHGTLAHELAHVRQFHAWGVLFPLAYSAASVWSLLRGRGLYWGNAFEVAARAAEKQR